MQRLDDGRYNKVANIIGHTMQYHPHGDASIGDALVQLGQKELVIDTQGNWGNILTGDSAAAPRYIEARLTAFASEVVFNPKTTEWMDSYDGRNREPVTLPVKFPLLLAQGVEGIAVGLASKILPHNFNELADAAVAHLKGKDFELFPDFPTGGLADCTRYNDGLRGGAVKVRARITKVDKKTVVITDIPYGKTTSSVIESILKANDKGKIKIRKVDDNTSQNVEIVVHLHNDVSPDKTIDALYAFTDCEVSISPNACVIEDNKPHFIGVKAILRHNAELTKNLLQQELQIRLAELHEDWHYSSLEKIFFEERIYRELESNANSWEAQLAAVEAALKPFEKQLRRAVTPEDINRLVEKPVRKISKFDIKQADERLQTITAAIAETENNLENIVNYTVAWFQKIKRKYGKNFVRKTELRNFETIEATQVVVANAKLYVNRAEGFVGMELKRDDSAEYIGECSDIDEIIVFLRNGKYSISKVQEKAFFGKDIIHAAVFKRNDERTVYNVAYRDGRSGQIYVKRFFVSGVTRDREYDLTQGKEGSDVRWFSANPNGEAEILKVYLKPRPKLKKLIFEFDFGPLAIKGRASMGNLLSRYPVHKIVLKEKGESTLGGQQIWFDADVQRLNTDRRGMLLGEFHNGERILVITKKGNCYTTGYDLSNRYDGELLRIEKFDGKKIFSLAYYEAEQKAFYIKRFTLEAGAAVPQSLVGEHPDSYLVELSDDRFPQAQLTFKGKQAHRPPEAIDVDEFIGVKSFRARGKRASIYDVKDIRFIDPLQKAVPEQPAGGDDDKAVQMSLL
jgi:topoisomerase-4 subunit A